MQGLVAMRPQHAIRRLGRAGCKIPVEIIAADRGEEYESQEPARRVSSQEQPGSLPDHHDRTDGKIKAAENKMIDYFSKQASSH